MNSQAETLTAMDIRALKAARDVYATINNEGQASLIAYGPESRTASPFSDGTCPMRRIDTRLSLKRTGSTSAWQPGITAHAWVGGQFTETWTTAVGCLKPGDTLTLDFHADALGGGMRDNGYLSMASITETDSRAQHDARLARLGDSADSHDRAYYSHATPAGTLHGDTVSLHVVRLTERDKLMGHNGKSFTFILTANVTPNNTARTILGLAD